MNDPLQVDVAARCNPDHLSDLRRSGLSDETIVLMDARSVVPQDVPGFENGLYARVDTVLELPYPNVENFSRYKLFPPIPMPDGRTMRYYHPSGHSNHLYILRPVAAVLTDIREPLLLVEGEKKAARAVQEKLNAIGFSGIWNWKQKDTWFGIDELKLIPFSCRDVEIVPDSETWARDDLQQAVYAFARYLESRGARVSIVLLPQPTAAKVGLDDYFLTYSLDHFCNEKRIDTKHATFTEHKKWYEKWKREKEDAVDDLQGKPLFLREIEPHTEPTIGADLLILLCCAIRRYVVAEPADIVAMALWCVHAHVIDAFDISAFLNLSSPEKGCGKSTTLAVLSCLLPRPLLSASVSPAAIFRAIELFKPCFLIDEADTFQNLHEELRGLLNASHLRASSQVIRTVGDHHEPRAFATWCPKAVALIGRLPDTLNDRSIVIEMKRRKREEACERFSAIDSHPELDLLARKTARWAADNFAVLREAKPEPGGIDLRLYDNWKPLLAVADAAGSEWPRWARIAAGWFAAKAAEAPSINVELLTDVVAVMGGQDMFSKHIVAALADMADKPWSTFAARRKPISQHQLGRILRTFGIKSQNIWTQEEQAKGYVASKVRTVQGRYGSAVEASEASGEIKDSKIEELEAIFRTLQSVRGEESEASGGANGHDADGFDWASGEQTEQGESDEQYWDRIKAEHAAKRAATK